MIVNTPLIFDKSKNGCLGYKTPKSSVPNVSLEKFIPKNRDVIQVVEKKMFNEFYPSHYPYKKIKGIKIN